MQIIHCPKCNKKVDEREFKDQEIIKKHCDVCNLDFWVLAEIELRTLVKFNTSEETKEK